MIVLEFCVDKSRLRYTTFWKPSTDLIPSEVIYHKMAIKVDAANKMILWQFISLSFFLFLSTAPKF